MISSGSIAYARTLLLVMGFLSLFIASVFLYHSKNYKRMLAYSSIENMGILAIATSLGGVAYYALMLHLIGHSLIKASFFLTSGNVLELFETKRIKSTRALFLVDKKTSWLWVLSFLGICAFPPSVLFISEFLIVKTFLIQKHFALCALFLFLLTIILFAMGRVVIKMAYGEKTPEKFERAVANLSKLDITMYIPQIVLLTFAFILGIYIPKIVDITIISSLIG
jgi:hydrogenase-4 component F